MGDKQPQRGPTPRRGCGRRQNGARCTILAMATPKVPEGYGAPSEDSGPLPVSGVPSNYGLAREGVVTDDLGADLVEAGNGKAYQVSRSTARETGGTAGTIIGQERAQELLRDELSQKNYEAAFGTGIVSKALSTATGALSGLSFGLAPSAIIGGAELLGDADYTQAARGFFRGAHGENPYSYQAGNIAGMLESGRILGAGFDLLGAAAGVESGLAATALDATGGGAKFGKFLSTLARGGAEGALYSTGAGLEDDLIHNRKLTAAGITSHALNGALFGTAISGLGAGFSALSRRGGNAISEVLEGRIAKDADLLAERSAGEAAYQSALAEHEAATLARGEAKEAYAAAARDVEEAKRALAAAQKSARGEVVQGLQAELAAREAAFAEAKAAAAAERQAALDVATKEELAARSAALPPEELALLRGRTELGLSDSYLQEVGDASRRAKGRGAYAGGFQEAIPNAERYLRETLGVEGRLDRAELSTLQKAVQTNKASLSAAQKLADDTQRLFGQHAGELAPQAQEVRDLYNEVMGRHFGTAMDGTSAEAAAAIVAPGGVQERLERAIANSGKNAENRWVAWENVSKELGKSNAAFYDNLAARASKGVADSAEAKIAAFTANLKTELDKLIAEKMKSAAASSPVLGNAAETYVAAKRTASFGAAMDREISRSLKKASKGVLGLEREAARAAREKVPVPVVQKPPRPSLREALSNATTTESKALEEAVAAKQSAKSALAPVGQAPKLSDFVPETPSAQPFFDHSDATTLAFSAMAGHPLGGMAAVAMRKGAKFVGEAFANTTDGISRRMKLATMAQKLTTSISDGVAGFMESSGRPTVRAGSYLTARGGSEKTDQEVQRIAESMSAARDADADAWARKVSGGDEELHAELMASRKRAQTYLSSIVPAFLNSPGDLKVPAKANLTAFQAHNFVTASRAIASPMEVFDAMKAGDVNREAVRAVTYVHPELKDIITWEVQVQLGKKRAKGETVPVGKLTQLSFALGTPVDRIVEPSFVAGVQKSYGEMAAAKQAAQSAKKLPQGSSADASAYQTATDRIQR